MAKKPEETLLDDTISQGIKYSSFEFLNEIGSGNFGKIYLVKLKSTQQTFAMKILSKKNLENKLQLKYAVSECNVLKKAGNHPFIIKLHYSFQVFYLIVK